MAIVAPTGRRSQNDGKPKSPQAGTTGHGFLCRALFPNAQVPRIIQRNLLQPGTIYSLRQLIPIVGGSIEAGQPFGRSDAYQLIGTTTRGGLTLGMMGSSVAAPLSERVEVGGVKLDRSTEAEIVQHIITRSQAGEGGWVVTPNVDICRQIGRDEQLRALVERATLVVADGMPLVWASKLSGQPLPERVAGSTLILSLSAAAATSGRSIYLIGGAPGAPEAAADRLSTMYPGLKVAGTDSPPFGFERSAAEVTVIRDRVCQAAPDIVYVGLGFPKQEKLIAALAPALPTAWFIGCGSAIGFAGGELRRAPVWMRRTGLEWIHRLLNEPRRLFRRYLIHDPPYAARLLAAACVTRVIRKVKNS